MHTRLAWKWLLIMVLGIIPGSAVVGLVFAPATWGFSFPLALFVIPLLFIIGGLLFMLGIGDLGKRKGMVVGMLVSALLWATVWLMFLMIPSRVQYLFRHTVPGLAESDLEQEGKQVAAAVNGTFIQSFVSDGDSRIAVEGWRGFVNASVRNGSLSIEGGTVDSLPSLDSVTVVGRLGKMSHPFLNARGRRVMQAGNILLRSRLHSIWSEFDVFVMDTGNIAIRSFITVHGLSFTINKGYSVLDE